MKRLIPTGCAIAVLLPLLLARAGSVSSREARPSAGTAETKYEAQKALQPLSGGTQGATPSISREQALAELRRRGVIVDPNDPPDQQESRRAARQKAYLASKQWETQGKNGGPNASARPEAQPPSTVEQTRALTLPPGFVLDTEPNKSKTGLTPEELERAKQGLTPAELDELKRKVNERVALEKRKENERVALEKLNRLGLGSLSNDDIENLPEEACAGLPFIECAARAMSQSVSLEQRRQVAVMLVELALHELGYYREVPTGRANDRLVDAVREFQKSIGAKPTGELLVGEWKELNKRSALVHPPEVHALSNVSVHVYEDFAFIKGTWEFRDGTESAFPLQASNIELNRRSKSGIEATAQIQMMGDAPESYLDVDITHWDILKWDDDEIVAENSRPAMVSYTMTVDIKGEKARMFRRPKGGQERGKATGLGNFEFEPQILELRNGWEVSRDFWQKRREKAMQTMAPAFREAWRTFAEGLQGAKPPGVQSEPNRPKWMDAPIVSDPNEADSSTQRPRWMDDPVVETTNVMKQNDPNNKP